MNRYAPTILFALAGCLSKPGPPGVIDAMGDGSVDMADTDMGIDAHSACQSMGTGAAPFPSDFVPERSARIIDLDRNGSDDVLVFGRIGTVPNVQVRGYVVLGRSPMLLDCYDFSFTPSQDGDLLDIWVGKVTNDALDDVAVLTKRGSEYLVDLYPGRPDPNGGLVFPPFSNVVANTMFGLDDDLGGSPTARGPVFVTGFRNNSFAGVVFGGVSQPWVVAPFTGTGLNPMVQVGDLQNGGAQFAALQPAEQVLAHAHGSPNNELLVVTTAGELRVITHDSTDSSAALFALPETPPAVNTTIDGGGKNRTVRAWHRGLAGGTTSIAAMEGATENIAIVRYRTFGSGSHGFASEHIQATADFAGGYTTVYDFGFGTLDGNAADPIDVVALTGTPGTARRLSVHRDLDFTMVVAGQITAVPPISTTTGVAGGTLAIGKFDPAAGAKDQILVLRPPAGGSLGTCYEVIDQLTTPCIAACGTTTCL